jgi:hypothetical protein
MLSLGATLEGVDGSSLVPMDEDGNIIIKKPAISGKVSTYQYSIQHAHTLLRIHTCFCHMCK